jgi:eukaryotic-like serine/threonine-protein kinase
MARREVGGDETLGAEGASTAPGAGLPTGALFAGRYRVEARVGTGGMGAVYRVRDERLDDVVALKVLTLDSDRAAERFVREVRLARKVTHRNVARTHDFGEAQGHSFLTMEFVEGDTLETLIEREGAQAPERAVELAEQIAAGLQAAHAAGVIHRDLKPANVMLASRGRVVLTDFGIARATETDGGKKTNDLIGTPLYMSPEQVRGRPVDDRSDLYALGLILYELLVGDLPFAGDTPIAMALARLDQPPPDPRVRASIPEDLAQIVLRCLSLDPAGRPDSAAALGAELARWRAARSGVGDRSRAPSEASGPGFSMSRSSTPALYAPLAAGRALAVLPFTYRGSAEFDYLGEGLAEELVDVLSRTRGLRVMALGATRRFADDRDPARVRAELGADVVVDGTVQASGNRVRITARLLDAERGVQRWTERFDGSLEDVFAFQESMGRRVAEALRLEVEASAYGHRVPEEAVQLYLGARRQLRADALDTGTRAVDMLDRCIALAPDFAPGLAAHAIASVRAWWGASVVFDEREPAEAAKQSVARAEERAPDIAETHLARAMFATQHGDFPTAAAALARALEIAPTLVEAHRYLSELQMEAARHDEGLKRAQLALELDPTQHVCRLAIARRKATLGHMEEARDLLDGLERVLDPHNLPLLATRIRFALYEGDHAALPKLLARLNRVPEGSGAPIASLLGLLVSNQDPHEAERARRTMAERVGNARFASLMGQFATEIYAAAGELDLAVGVLREIADGALIDVAWLESLALFAPLRERPEYPDIVARVRERASAIWRRT